MCNRHWAAATVLVLASTTAGAQAAKPEPASESATAMERARRQAAGPMRIILEASKARRKAGETDAPAASDTNAVRPVAARAAGAPAVAAPAAAVPAAEPPAPRAPPEPAAAVDGGVVTQITLSPDRVQGAARSGAVPALERSAAAPVEAVALPDTSEAALPALAQTPVRPKLTTMVEPEVPQRVLDGMNRNTAVMVDLTIRANGSVAAVELVPPAPRQLQRYLAAALEQWRFDPLPAERVHRIELVFNADR